MPPAMATQEDNRERGSQDRSTAHIAAISLASPPPNQPGMNNSTPNRRTAKARGHVIEDVPRTKPRQSPASGKNASTMSAETRLGIFMVRHIDRRGEGDGAGQDSEDCKLEHDQTPLKDGGQSAGWRTTPKPNEKAPRRSPPTA